jgi:hypothetical protein
MARDSGGGGAFGWTVLGILVGVAGTLAVETLLNTHQAREVNEEQAVSSASAAVAAVPAPPKPAVKPLSAAVAQKSDATTLSQDDVEDDAAAAGMTSRSRPRDSQNSSALAGAAN